MPDTEVENTLREIRERVRAEAQAQTPAPRAAHDAAVAASSHEAATAATTSGVGATGALARLEAQLATIERTWDKLPPLTSYRRGWAARVELWLKRQVKRATHWYTWEQVNFNAAVHHALRDTLRALAAEQQDEQRRAALQASFAAMQTKFDDALRQFREETEATLKALEQRFAGESEDARGQLALVAGQFRNAVETLRAEQRAVADALRGELRDRVEHLTDEQRVSFRQLALETSETAIVADRTRRALELRLDELAKRVMSDE